MSKSTIHEHITPGVMSLLPMIYVGWSDSVLSPSEMKLIDTKIQSMTFLDEADKKYLCSIIDPKKPPSPAVFKAWLKTIKSWSANVPLAERKTLADLGISLARSGVGQRDIMKWEDPETRLALVNVEQALGIEGYVSRSILIGQLLDKEALDTASSLEFDIEDLKNLLDGPYGSLKKRVRKLLRDPIFRLEFEPNKDVYRKRVLDQILELAKQGLGGYAFPEKYNGKEDSGAAIHIFETLAYGDLSTTVKFGVQFGLFGGSIFQLGTERHHSTYLNELMNGRLLGCFAMTETGHGSNVKDLETTASYHHDTKSITVHSPTKSAGKEYIGNALHCTLAVVFAKLMVGGEDQGIHAVLVPVRNAQGKLLKGIKVLDSGYKMGLNGVDNGRIWFDQVSVPVDNLLDRFGTIDEQGNYHSDITNSSKRFFTMLGTLVLGRISVGLASVSAIKKSLLITIKYSLKRRQFGSGDSTQETLILDYPTHQLRLFPALASVYAYHFALHDLVTSYQDAAQKDLREIETLAAGLKAKASWLSTKTIQECREACGGKGYLQENQLASLKADADIFTTFEGDNTVLMQLVSKALLTEFKQSFHEEGVRAVMRYLLTRVSHSIDEINPIYKRNTDFGHITSSDFIHHAFEYRYKKTLITLSQRMQRYLRQGLTPYQAFLRTQVHMVDLAHAYIDLHVLQSFSRAVSQIEIDPLKEYIKDLYIIYGLHTIFEQRAWYLENDYMDGSKTKAIRRARTKLFQRIRPNIRAALDAFDFPEELIAAPIARSIK